MKKYSLPVIAAAEAAVIILLAVLLLNSADRKDLSHLSEEKQISYLHSEGVEFDEKYNAYALLMIKNVRAIRTLKRILQFFTVKTSPNYQPYAMR